MAHILIPCYPWGLVGVRVEWVNLNRSGHLYGPILTRAEVLESFDATPNISPTQDHNSQPPILHPAGDTTEQPTIGAPTALPPFLIPPQNQPPRLSSCHRSPPFSGNRSAPNSAGSDSFGLRHGSSGAAPEIASPISAFLVILLLYCLLFFRLRRWV